MKINLLVASILANILSINGLSAAENASEQVPLSLPFISNDKLVLKLPHDGAVVYNGVVSFDDAGTGQGGMLYPAPNAAGLIAAIVTHGLLINSAKKEQKNKLQASADQVLSTYNDILTNFKYKELMERSIAKLSSNFNSEYLENPAFQDNEVVIESSPIFMLTQDQQAIIINDDIAIRILGKKPEVVYKNAIRVISTANDSSDSISFWANNNGENLKDVSAQLLAKSIVITLQGVSATNPESNPYQTIRYRVGLSEKIERAQVIDKSCDRMLIRNLRGVLMSVPVSKSVESDCNPVSHI